MTRQIMSCIERTCPSCGTENRVLTTDIRPTWRMNCSRCGEPIPDPSDVGPPAAELGEATSATPPAKVQL